VSIDERRNRATRSFLLSDTHSGGPGRVAPVANIFKNAIPQPRNCPTEIAQPIKHKDEKDAVDSAIVCGNVQRKPEWKYFTANCQCSSQDSLAPSE